MSEKDIRDVRISYAAARVNKRLTQPEAAKALNISLSTLLNYETGKTIPDWDMHNRMADFYGLPSGMLCPPKK